MLIDVNLLTEYAGRCDRCLNHDYKRVRVEDQIGRQDVNWEVYKRFEAEGATLLMTADDHGRLAGFVLYILYVHPNHPDAHLGHCQFLIVHPDYRGKGLGKTLIEAAEVELKKRNCTHVIHGRRMVYDIVPLFTKLGFEKFEESYIKEIK